MSELVTQEGFGAGLRVFLVIAFVLCWAVGVAHGWRARTPRRSVALGGLASLLAPLTYALWCLYTYNVRYDPQTGTAGLHRVSVFLLNLAVFVAVGAVVGVVAALLLRRTGAPAVEPDGD